MVDIKEVEKSFNNYIASRTVLDLNAVYERLKDKYSLVFTNTFSLENGEEEYGDDFMILCGTSVLGVFQLYDNGLHIIFDVDKADGKYLHWHPSDLEEAIKDVIKFMEGTHEYCV